MKRFVLVALAGFLLNTTFAGAQEAVRRQPADGPQIVAGSMNSAMSGDRIDVDFMIDYTRTVLHRDEMLVVTPYIVNGSDSLAMEPVVFLGDNQRKKENRRGRLYGDEPEYGQAYEKMSFSKREMRRKQREVRNSEALPRSVVQYTASVPYASWMEGSQLVLHHQIEGCCNRGFDYYTGLGTIYSPVAPMVMFIAPEVEAVKARSDVMTARIVFRVDKYDIRRDLYDNATELDRIYSFTEKVLGNGDVTLTGITLKGYASPEASWAHNDRLSRNRVNALRSELQNKFRIDGNMISIENVPEDWDSVRRWVAASDIRFRDRILDIIDSTPDPDARDAKIRSLDNSSTYNMLLHDVYPGLRRVEYTINYNVMPFTVERGREVMRTNPRHLSLDELYRIARSYPVDSPEYAEVFAIAVRNFPNDPIANNNMAALAMSRGDYQAARAYLQQSATTEQSLNNRGIMAAIDGDYEQAREYFRRAAEAGSSEAAFNLENLYRLRR